jgi:hypothetical protein
MRWRLLPMLERQFGDMGLDKAEFLRLWRRRATPANSARMAAAHARYR